MPVRCLLPLLWTVGAGWVGLSAPAAAAITNTLTVCSESSPDGFDIVQYESAVTNDAAGLPLYDPLLLFKPGSTELIPALAERWSISPDGLAYTFHLRRGVQFHSTPWFTPTREFNADDVLFSFNRLMDKAHPAHASARNGYVYWEGMGMGALIRRIDKLDAHTVRFTLSKPEAPFLSAMAMSSIASIYPAEYGLALARSNQLDRLNTHPVGSGPFVFQRYQKDAVIRYRAHDGYWGGRPKVDRLVIGITTDPNVRVQRLLAGECLVGTNLKAETADIFERDPLVKVLRTNALLTAYVAPNAKKPFLADRRFREALWLALDMKTYLRAVYGGHASPAGSFLPPGQWSHDATLARAHDPERARALVKESGYDGRELQLWTRIGGSIDGKRAAELMQADWARVGIRVKVVMMEWGELLKRSGQGEHDITFLSWAGDNGDPDNFFTPNVSCAAVKGGGNKSQWCHPGFEALIDRARAATDPKQRDALYRQAQRILFDEVGIIPMAYPVYMTAVHRRVQGFLPSPFTNNDFRHVRLAP